jgi:Leucine-rich repeat (LRR) protein
MQHDQLISLLTVKVYVREDRLKPRELCDAVATCRSIDLTIHHPLDEVVDLSDLEAVAGSLNSLTCEYIHDRANGRLRGTSTLSRMSQLTALHLHREDLGNEEPWGLLAELTSLQQLDLAVGATGDPSPLSALTGLSSLRLESLRLGGDGPAPFSFSSLQPLSTLQQLEQLRLVNQACDATSLQDLAGLSKLKELTLYFRDDFPRASLLRSLQGINPGLVDLYIMNAHNLVSLAGIEVCTSMEVLFLSGCGVSSLQPAQRLSSLERLSVYDCHLTNWESLRGIHLQFVSPCTALTHLSEVEQLPSLKHLTLSQKRLQYNITFCSEDCRFCMSQWLI